MAMIGMCFIKEAVTYPIVEAGDDTDKQKYKRTINTLIKPEQVVQPDNQHISEQIKIEDNPNCMPVAKENV